MSEHALGMHGADPRPAPSGDDAGPPPPPGERAAPRNPAAGDGCTLADDATLIEVSRGEPEAFAAIFDRHATQIHRFATRRLGAAVAEDVVARSSWWRSAAGTVMTWPTGTPGRGCTGSPPM